LLKGDDDPATPVAADNGNRPLFVGQQMDAFIDAADGRTLEERNGSLPLTANHDRPHFPFKKRQTTSETCRLKGQNPSNFDRLRQ